MTEKNEMLALAERIESSVSIQDDGETLSAPLLYKHEWDAIVSALRAAASAEPVAWQPIETAPREQTILVAGGDASYPVTACWSGLSDECWMVDGQEDVHAEIGWPTHWMLLPEFSK